MRRLTFKKAVTPVKLLDPCSTIRRFATSVAEENEIPLLRWVEAWYAAAGSKTVLGLVDSHVGRQIPDLFGADVIIRRFTRSQAPPSAVGEHGAHSLAVLVGQGHTQIRGIVPQARLLVADVVEPDGIAMPQAVAEGIDWLVSSGVRLVAIPLGDTVDRTEIAHQIEENTKRGITFFAAAGNGYPDPLLFPARHPLAIAVGAADERGILLPECSRIPRLDLVAPGHKIAAPIGGRVIRRRRGTSTACVIAAGVATLAASAGAISPKELCRSKLLAILDRNSSARSSLRENWVEGH